LGNGNQFVSLRMTGSSEQLEFVGVFANDPQATFAD